MTETELYDSYLKAHEDFVKSLQPVSFEELINTIPVPFRQVLSLLENTNKFKFNAYNFKGIINHLITSYGLEDLIEDWCTEFDPIEYDPDFTILNIMPLNNGDTKIGGPFQKFIDAFSSIGIKIEFY